MSLPTSRPASLPTERYIYDHAAPAQADPELYAIDDEIGFGGGFDASSQRVSGQPLTLGGLIGVVVLAWALCTLALALVQVWQERPQAPAYVATETRLRCLECGAVIRSISDPIGSGVCKACRGAQVAKVIWGARR